MLPSEAANIGIAWRAIHPVSPSHRARRGYFSATRLIHRRFSCIRASRPNVSTSCWIYFEQASTTLQLFCSRSELRFPSRAQPSISFTTGGPRCRRTRICCWPLKSVYRRS
jgi:hypothetical protein